MSGNSLNFNQSSVGTSRAVIVGARTIGKGYIVKNIHASQTLYLGDVTVTTGNGFPLLPGESIPVNGFVGDLYGVGSGAATSYAYLGAF